MKFVIKNRRSNKKLIVLLTILIIVLITISLTSLKLYLDTQKSLQQLKSKSSQNLPVMPTTDEIKAITDTVGRHYLLPDETPKLITIVNAEVLKKTQPFFAKAKNGDKLLVYSQKVILYDPLNDKIIDVAQIQPQEEPVISLAPTKAPSASAEGQLQQ